MQALFLQSADLTAAAGFTKVKADFPFWPDGLMLSLTESTASPRHSRRWKGWECKAGSPAPPAEVLSSSELQTGWEAKSCRETALGVSLQRDYSGGCFYQRPLQGFLQVERKAKLEGFILHVFLTISHMLPDREQRNQLPAASPAQKNRLQSPRWQQGVC